MLTFSEIQTKQQLKTRKENQRMEVIAILNEVRRLDNDLDHESEKKLLSNLPMLIHISMTFTTCCNFCATEF